MPKFDQKDMTDRMQVAGRNDTIRKLRQKLKRAVDLAMEMKGFVASQNLSNEGPDSPYRQWKKCRDEIVTLHKELQDL